MLAGERVSPWVTTVVRAGREADSRTWTYTIVFALRGAKPVETASLGAISSARGALLPVANDRHILDGMASYYWQDQMTANGEVFDKYALTAAHKTLPLGTRVRVTSLANGRSVVVRINDRGPFVAGRVIDLSEAAATRLGMQSAGLAPVRMVVLNN